MLVSVVYYDDEWIIFTFLFCSSFNKGTWNISGTKYSMWHNFIMMMNERKNHSFSCQILNFISLSLFPSTYTSQFENHIFHYKLNKFISSYTYSLRPYIHAHPSIYPCGKSNESLLDTFLMDNRIAL